MGGGGKTGVFVRFIGVQQFCARFGGVSLVVDCLWQPGSIIDKASSHVFSSMLSLRLRLLHSPPSSPLLILHSKI